MTRQELDAVRENTRRATTEDLLDRVTVYRDGMDPDAVNVIEAELARRGVGPLLVAAYNARNTAGVLRDENGVALMCSYCNRPAIVEEPDQVLLWGGLLGKLLGGYPLPQGFRRYCADHRPAGLSPASSSE